MGRSKSRWWVAGAVSVAVHVGLAAGLVLRPPEAPPRVEAPTTVTLNFTVPPPAAPAPDLPLDPAPEVRAPAEPTPPAARRRASRRRPVAVPPPGGERDVRAEETARELAGEGGGTTREAPAAAAPPTVDLALHPRPSGPALVPPGLAPPRAGTRLGPAGARRPKLKPRADGGYEVRDSQFTADIAPDGAITFRDKTALQKWHGVAYEIDVTDVVMRAAGDDPYRYEKQKILRETAGLRAKMAQEACEARLEEALVSLRARLEATWGDLERSPEARRALLFSLWDDCAEDGDPRQVATAHEARRLVYEFIRERLPKGSAHAYTAGELVALNARRRSKAAFRPY